MTVPAKKPVTVIRKGVNPAESLKSRCVNSGFFRFWPRDYAGSQRIVNKTQSNSMEIFFFNWYLLHEIQNKGEHTMSTKKCSDKVSQRLLLLSQGKSKICSGMDNKQRAAFFNMKDEPVYLTISDISATNLATA